MGMDKGREFYVFLSNNKNSGNNTNFQVPLAFPLHFSPQHAWSVAVTDVAFTNHTLNLHEGDTIEVYKKAELNVQIFNEQYKKGDRLTDNNWLKVEENETILLKPQPQEGYENVRIKVNDKESTSEGIDVSDYVTLTTKRTKEPLQITVTGDILEKLKRSCTPTPGSHESIDTLLDSLNEAAGKVYRDRHYSFDFHFNRVVVNIMKDKYWLKLTGNLPRLLGFEQSVLLDRNTVASFPVDLKPIKDQTLCIYSNLCENSMFNNTLVPLLSLVHMSLNDNDLAHFAIQNPLYLPVVIHESLSSILIDLRTLNHHAFPLSPNATIVLTLHFRKL